MPHKPAVYVAADGSQHPTIEQARRRDDTVALKALAGISVEEIVDGIRATTERGDAIRAAIMLANNRVQAFRKETGQVRPRKRPA